MASVNESGDKGGSATARAARLLDRGLERYGAGDLVAALADWEQALILDSSLARAREYLEYVRENFDVLQAEFRAAKEASDAAAQQGVPLGEGGPDSGEYDSLDVQLGTVSGAGLADLDDGLAQLDAGLERVLEQPEDAEPEADADAGESPPAVELEAMAPDEDLPGIAPDLDVEPASDDEATIDVRVLPALRREYDFGPVSDLDFDDLPQAGSRPDIMTILPRTPVSEPPQAPVASELEMPGIDLSAIDDTVDVRSTLRGGAMPPVRVAPSKPLATTPPPAHPLGEGEEEETTRAFDRRGGILVTPRLPRGAGISPDDFTESEFTAEYEDMRKTREHNPFASGAASPRGRLGRPAPEPISLEGVLEGGDSSVIVDERLLDGAGLSGGVAEVPPGSDPDRTSDFRPRRDPAKEVREDRIRARVTELLKIAEDAAQKGEFLRAVSSVEEVMHEDEEGVIAPVLLHRHRDLLYRIYEGHIGDMNAVPLVAVPLHEIAGQALDHRTGFLLSRIDGMLSFEDILDVAGMPRMEAYQILSNLLRKGVIEVR